MTRTPSDEIARLLAELHGLKHVILSLRDLPPGVLRYTVARIEDAEATAERARAALAAATADQERAWLVAQPPVAGPFGEVLRLDSGRASW